MSLLLYETLVSSPKYSFDSVHQKNAHKDINHLKYVNHYLLLWFY